MIGQTLAAAGASVRRVPYLLETEVIRDSGDGSSDRALSVVSRSCSLIRGVKNSVVRTVGADARAARDAFALMWQNDRQAAPVSLLAATP